MMGTVQVMTPEGPMQANFPFPEGVTLREAFDGFEEFANAAFEEHQKEESSKILVPGKDF